MAGKGPPLPLRLVLRALQPQAFDKIGCSCSWRKNPPNLLFSGVWGLPQFENTTRKVKEEWPSGAKPSETVVERILSYPPRRSRAAEGSGYSGAIGVLEHEDG